jgi:hypothetical protein
MRRIIFGFFFWLISLPAFAGVPCTLPFNLANGTTADATQVMANYNALVTCLLTAAAAGNNSDITALLGLTTPLSPTFGGSPFYLGATSSGTNALVVSSTTPNTFSLLTGKTVAFLAGSTNTGSATLNVSGTGVLNLFRAGQTGPTPLIGGEIQAGQIVFATYDGTQYEMVPQASYASLIATNQTVSGGANVTSYSGGSQSGGGTYSVNCANGPLQFITNAGNFTIAAPSFDSSCQILSTNASGAGTVSYSGFTVGANIGDTLNTTLADKFIISITRINGVSTYFQKALQ